MTIWTWYIHGRFERAKGGLKSTTWETAYDNSEDSSMVMCIVDLLMTLPPTSVSCETCFSQMKLVKTSRRTRLQQKTLNDLLVVRLASPSMQDFDPDQAIDHWMVMLLKYARIFQYLANLKRYKDLHLIWSINESEIYKYWYSVCVMTIIECWCILLSSDIFSRRQAAHI